MQLTLLYPELLETEQMGAEDEKKLIILAQRRYEILHQGVSTPEERHVIRAGDRALTKLLHFLERAIYKRVDGFIDRYPNCEFQDIKQSLNEVAIQAIHTFEIDRGVRLITWVWHKITGRLTLMARREDRNSKIHQKVYKDVKDAVFEVDNTSIEVKGDSLDLAERITELMADLSLELKRIIELRSQGVSYQDIGESVGKSADACRMTFNRVKKQIQEVLQTELCHKSSIAPEEVQPAPKLLPNPEQSEIPSHPVRFWSLDRYNQLVQVLRRKMQQTSKAKVSDVVTASVMGLICAGTIGFSFASIGRMPVCAKSPYNL